MMKLLNQTKDLASRKNLVKKIKQNSRMPKNNSNLKRTSQKRVQQRIVTLMTQWNSLMIGKTKTVSQIYAKFSNWAFKNNVEIARKTTMMIVSVMKK